MVTNGTTRTGVDFVARVGRPASSRGTVTTPPGIGLPNVQVSIYNAAGVVVKSVTSAANTGIYSVRGLAAGDVLRADHRVSGHAVLHRRGVSPSGPCAVRAVRRDDDGHRHHGDRGHHHEQHRLPDDGRRCHLGERVHRKRPPIRWRRWTCSCSTTAGTLVKTTFTGSTGNFEFDGLPAGTYFAVARGPAGYLDERYLNMPCTASPGGCVVTAGTPIVVTNGATQGGIAFTLSPAPPTLTLVSPSGARRGSTNLIVGLIGQFTHFVQGTTSATFGAGITVNSITVLTAAQAIANVTIAGGATLGARTVTVATGAEVVALASGFVVGPLTQTRADLDGDSRTDITVYRPSNGTWYSGAVDDGRTVRLRLGEQRRQAGRRRLRRRWQDGHRGVPAVERDVVHRALGDRPAVQATRGAMVRIFPCRATSMATAGRTSRCSGRRMGRGRSCRQRGRRRTGFAWGNGADLPVPGDYDGDGRTDTAIFRPSTGVWHVMRSSTGTPTALPWGNGADRPVPGDYDGDGKIDIAVFRPSNGVWLIVPSTTGVPYGYAWGNGADIAVPGDFDGDGKTDIAVFRPSNGVWYVVPSTGAAPYGFAWGNGADIPILRRP